MTTPLKNYSSCVIVREMEGPRLDRIAMPVLKVILEQKYSHMEHGTR